MRQTKEMRLVYSDFLAQVGQEDTTIAAIEADLSSSMATNKLSSVLGGRYVNVGIMEQEMVGVAAGLSLLGYKPYIHTFGPFASRRVYDQVFISLAYAQLNATVIGSDAGVSAEMNGGTHMPFEELGLMRLIPKARVYEVSDDVQFQAVLKETIKVDGLKYIRTIRKAPTAIYQGGEDFSKGYCVLRQGEDMTLLASGIMVEQALKAADQLEAQGVSVQVIDLFRIKPIHEDIPALLSGRPVLTVENHNRIGGLGSSICELMATDLTTPVHRIGIEESFGQVGQQVYLMDVYGLTAEHIVKQAQLMLQQ
ncbi:TPA: transketolase family protein [Streptococcus suis]|uniref:Transketolase family protein n=1 Tax=Streptococcus suis TaxID=1307 RepID=A0A7T1LAF7_STRSU|nr:transketolase C-terminal domain-containing protein [Streptococcus suis]MCQ8785740.1 transketolase family protein [Streptococcus suis]MDY7596960.1 transketolase C-terminal domain-containing protein [Streptococcus suis]QPO26766.1 transketolase family protein [Streptococcus suis]WQE85519.1 transketolase C-terminal domain-containing protein [Streptococcus suis]HEL1651767.1 transketolase family protein [Streptococcus suis]